MIAVIYGLFFIMGFIGNLLVLLVVCLNRSFHYMRYSLLASLALSDFLFTTLVTSNRTVVFALERWIFGDTWCHGSAYLIRVLHISTVFHLCAISYERYNVIFKNPLNYDGHITKKRAIVNVTLLWVIPAAMSLGPLVGWGGFVYNSEMFVCEQKWDGQTTLPFLGVTFFLPLGVIVFLNFRVLKVVGRLQRGMKIISVPPQVHPVSENKMHDDYDQQEDKYVQQEPNDQGSSQNRGTTNQPKLQNLIERRTFGEKVGGMKGNINTAFYEELEDIDATIHREETVRQSRNGVSPERRCSCTEKACKKQCSLDDAEKIRKISNGDDISLMQFLHRKRTEQVVDHDHEKYVSQVTPPIRDVNTPRDHQQMTTQKNNAFESNRGPLNSSEQNEKPEVETNDDSKKACKSVEATKRFTVKKQLLNPAKGKRNVTQPLETQILKQVVTQSWPVTQTQKTDSMSICKELPSKCSVHKSEKPERQPQGEIEPPVNTRKKQRPLGKTQRRLAKLLKEGKAAVDVMFITGVFLLCYLPMWTLACYRTFGGEPSAEAILSTHCFYVTTMIWNPIIYSIRKKEFRKAVRKLLKL